MVVAGSGSLKSVQDVLRAEHNDLIDDVALIAAPGMTDAASYDALLSHAENMQDRVAILDGPEKASKIERLTRVYS